MGRDKLRFLAACSLLSIGLAMPVSGQAFTFSSPVAIDDSRPAGEPGIIIDAGGRIFVNAPPGVGTPSYVWRSQNGGAGWAFRGPGTVGASPNGSGVEEGGGDSNLASDAQSNLYFVDLWIGNSSTAAS